MTKEIGRDYSGTKGTFLTKNTVVERPLPPKPYKLDEAMDLGDNIIKLLTRYAEMHDATIVTARLNLKKEEWNIKFK